MIFFGTNAKAIFETELEEPCVNCGQPAVIAGIFQKYFHLYWIPTIPYAKTAVTHCEHCGQEFEDSDVPQEYRRSIDELKQYTTTPMYLYSGAIVAAVIVMIIGVIGWSNSREADAIVAAPMVDDLYIMDMRELTDETEPGYPYAVFHVTGVVGDSVEVQISSYAYEHTDGATYAIDYYETDEEGYYVEEAFTIAIEDLQLMREYGAVEDVVRR